MTDNWMFSLLLAQFEAWGQNDLLKQFTGILMTARRVGPQVSDNQALDVQV